MTPARDPDKLPPWMRWAMGATAAMNLVGAFAFVPAAGAVRRLAGFPEDAHPLYMLTFGAFVFVFGAAYLVTARSGRADRTFIGVAAAGKLAFFGLLIGLWIAGDLPGRALLAGAGDGVFGAIFAAWLVRTNGRLRRDAGR